MHIRPTGGIASTESTFKYCLNNNLLGVGWRIDSDINDNIDWQSYLKQAQEKFSDLKIVKYLKTNINENDLIWTRDWKGQYYLAKVKSPWEYLISDISLKSDIDIANVVKVDFVKIEIDEVPGKVVACFRARRTLQRIDSNVVEEYSKHMWNIKTKTNHFNINKDLFKDIFTFLDFEEIEDLIFIYLQTSGYVVIPNSRKADTMSYEFLLINNYSKKRYLIQIKSGNTHLDINNYSDLNENYLLFQPYGFYINDKPMPNNITIIEPKIILDFLKSKTEFLPKLFIEKMKIIGL